LNLMEAELQYLSFYDLIFTSLNEEEKSVVLQKAKIGIRKVAELKFGPSALLRKVYGRYLKLKYIHL
jgi:hypothetical protein